MLWLIPILAVGGFGVAVVLGKRARERDAESRGPASGAQPENAKAVTASSGRTYLVAMIGMVGETQTFDVWTSETKPVWLLRYSHNRETKKRLLLGRSPNIKLEPLVTRAREDFGV